MTRAARRFAEVLVHATDEEASKPLVLMVREDTEGEDLHVRLLLWGCKVLGIDDALSLAILDFERIRH
jgi:hypothetical protein